MAKIMMQLDELACPSCMQKIQAAMSQQAGVVQVKVLFNASKVKAEFDTEITTPEKLTATVQGLGYNVQNVKVQAE